MHDFHCALTLELDVASVLIVIFAAVVGRRSGGNRLEGVEVTARRRSSRHATGPTREPSLRYARGVRHDS